ncbi:MAG: nitrate- and nitrite sensing domain-containing protein [Actinophytocola sp.]|uniref:sensor histidine kinase n=1 Tax=Actinophytocola sp. TaxID=1872138 RepID=UPI003D6BB50B
MSGRATLARYTGAARGVLNKLRIRGKLNLLLALPLAAILLVAVPYVTAQVSDAGSAARTANLSGQTRQVGALVSALQRERLVMSAFLAGVTGRESVTRQYEAVDVLTENVRETLGTDASAELAQALEGLDSLDSLRQSVLNRAATQESLARTYLATNNGLIDALRLVPQQGSDAEGTRQLTSLEALLRANEQNTLAGMALIISAFDREAGLPILDDARSEGQISTIRFVQQADIEQAGLVVDVEQGNESRAVEALVEDAPGPRGIRDFAFAASAYNAVNAQSKLREVVQDQVTAQITDAAGARADNAAALAWLIGGGVLLLIALVAALSVAVSRSIANPMKQLTKAATDVATLADTELVRVADTEMASDQVPRLSAIQVSTRDEVGELAQAFNRVQATAAMLVERQAVTRQNVSLMFANVAQRTQNLVGRQLTLVDELERNEQDTRLLESLYKLDHLSTRLRRSADNLLVISGTRNETKLTGPIELATALRSALAEIEDYPRVQLDDVVDITLDSAIGSDLVLVFAELLENATSYSPPETQVEVRTRLLVDGSCLINVVDHGIGMPQERLAEENRRLVARERLDIAPTSMLGLFVVGRLARRHHLTVALVATDDGGVTVDVVIPDDKFLRNEETTTPQPAVPEQVNGWPGQLLPGGVQIPPAAYSPAFSWFPSDLPVAEPDPEPEPAVSTTSSWPALPAMSAPEPQQERAGLRRRVPGTQMPGASSQAEDTGRHAQRDAAHDRGAFDGYQNAVARATEQLPPIAPTGETSDDGTRAGLTRRVPGESMAPGLRIAKPGRPPARVSTKWRERDPDADRTKLDQFTMGLSRAGSAPTYPEADA